MNRCTCPLVDTDDGVTQERVVALYCPLHGEAAEKKEHNIYEHYRDKAAQDFHDGPKETPTPGDLEQHLRGILNLPEGSGEVRKITTLVQSQVREALERVREQIVDIRKRNDPCDDPLMLIDDELEKL